jgi:hypothetical protein
VRSSSPIVCLVSAADVHDLSDEIPSAVQIAVPRASRPPHISFPPTTVFRFEPSTFELGLTRLEALLAKFVEEAQEAAAAPQDELLSELADVYEVLPAWSAIMAGTGPNSSR